MFSIRVFNPKKEREKNFQASMANIADFISNKINQKNKFISDNSSIEIISGELAPSQDGQVVTELVIRKTIVINKDDFNDKFKLDRYLAEVRHFCEQAKEIEEVKYLPPHLRNPEKDKQWPTEEQDD